MPQNDACTQTDMGKGWSGQAVPSWTFAQHVTFHTLI
jgi:hypothetical protein